MRSAALVLAVVFTFILSSLPRAVLGANADDAGAAASDIPIDPSPAPDDDGDQRSIAPWVLGGILVGGGAAAAIALSQDDDDDDDDDDDAAPAAGDAPPAAATCDDNDAIGTWESDEVHDGTITRSATYILDAGGSGTMENYTENSGPPPSAMSSSGPVTWDMDGCHLRINGDAVGDISDGQFSDNGYNFHKQ